MSNFFNQKSFTEKKNFLQIQIKNFLLKKKSEISYLIKFFLNLIKIF